MINVNYQQNLKPYHVYKIKKIETNDYVCNCNGEHCEALSHEWAKMLADSYKRNNPDVKLEIIKEEKNVKRESSQTLQFREDRSN